MVRFLQVIAAAGLALTCAFAPACAEKRVALVIGNDRYANLSSTDQLQKAVNDAHAVGGALKQIGFEVIPGENLGRGALLGKLNDLVQQLTPGDTVFFFFSGHGVALDGVNYILPADVPNVAAGQETRLKGEALSEQYIISELTGRGVRVAVVVLDACRTNPFGRSGGKSIGGDKGLAPPPQVKGVFSLYAASSGQAARDRLSDDDRNPNSVFSRVLVPALTKPGLDLTALAFNVREEVAQVAHSAGYVQEPSYYDGTIGGRVYLAGAPAANEAPNAGLTMANHAPAQPDPAERAWLAVQNTTSIAVLEEFRRQFPNTVFAAFATARIKELDRPQPVTAPPPAPAVVAPPPTPAQPAAVVAPAASPPNVAVPNLPVQLAAKDLTLLDGFDGTRARALAIADATKKAESQKDRDDLAAVLSGSAMPITPKDLAGEWRCRTLKLENLGLFIYDFFKCRISARGDSLVFQKTTGSQRTQGKLYRLTETRYLYVGASTVNDDPPIAYGTKPEDNDVAYLVRVGANRLRLEFPREVDPSNAAFDIMELRK
jgi:hypothetical protein